MRYKKTKLILPTSPKAPLWTRDMIKRLVQCESEREFTSMPTPRLEAPRAFKSPLKKSVGLANFFKSNVETFVMQFKP